MRNFLLTAVIFLNTALSFAQEVPKLPIDSTTKKITYSEVISVDSSTNKEELYSRAREWFAKTYRSSTSVIQMEDKESGKIIGKALMHIYYKGRANGYIHYTISIYIKDGRYKYEITDFYHTGEYVSGYQIPDYGLCEMMINTKDKFMGISMQKNYNGSLSQMDGDIKQLIADLKAAMATKLSVQKNDW